MSGSSHVTNITIPVMNPPTYWLPDEHSYAQASGICIWSLDLGPRLLNPFMSGLHTHIGTSFKAVLRNILNSNKITKPLRYMQLLISLLHLYA